MCGRFTLHHSADEIAERFVAELLPDLEPRYNIAPTQPVTVVTQNGARHLAQYHWGLIPSWAKDPKIGSRMINARAETLAEKPAFRTALKRRRCLIPADGFYEWQEADNPAEGGRTPMFIHRKDNALFAFAGLWDEWHTPDGSPLRSCTIITGTPNPLIAPIHDRMPIILRPEDEGRWLDGSVADTQSLLSLLAPYPADELETYPVSRRVNTPTADDPALVQRA
ncbi:MAG: SOS response-associated peptidase [Armatimonadetes bacterium]|nr:SOS response-associated peptidase [Armatimonadota bacterium]